MDYRLITLSSTGEPAQFEDWSCASDMEAIERASRVASAYGRELWRGDQCVSTFAGALSARAADDKPESRA